MKYQKTVIRVKNELRHTLDTLDTFFDIPQKIRQIQPASDEWSIDEILEHITLTNHFLMITLDNSRDKVLRRAQTQVIPDAESDLDRIKIISDPDAFDWIRPEHMQPTGVKPMTEVRELLRQQMNACLQILDDIKNGEGVLHTVRMSVQDLGKLDMYQWMYFLVQHAKRHITEIDRIIESNIA